jgi:DNA-binding CsgD family transcriptional regulator
MSKVILCHVDVSKLTPAEENVYRLIGQGWSNKEIAAMLFISLDTVRTHVKRIHEKLNIEGRARLAIASYRAHEEARV